MTLAILSERLFVDGKRSMKCFVDLKGVNVNVIFMYWQFSSVKSQDF